MHNEQTAAEKKILLEQVEPVLESVDFIDRDGFWESILDEIRPGEPLIYPDPPIKFDKDRARELNDQRKAR